jgi:hypothetical protein
VTRSDWLSLLVLAPVAWTFVVQPHGRVVRAEAGRTTAVAVGATVTASWRSVARRCVMRCASWIGIGISASVSSVAYPNIIPWSPAPPVSTPIAMSGDCRSIVESTAQVWLSKP